MATGWLRGRVKAITSGDCLVIVGNVKSGPPPEKTVTLSSLIAPKLARRDTRDEPFAWQSREYLRQKCIGQEVVFKIDYVVPSINREFGSVFLGNTNLALDIVTNGWAKVRPPIPNSTDVSPYIEQLQKAEEQAKEQALGMWNKTPGAAEASIRNLPPSGVGQDSGFDAQALLDSHKGLTLAAVVEQVRDGSTIRVFLLPSFQYVQVYVAGVQCPAVGRKLIGEAAPTEAAADSAATAAAADGVANLSVGEDTTPGTVSAAQRLAASADKEREKVESGAEPYALEAKHYTETRCLNREVRVTLEGVDGRFSNLVGSVHYSDAEGQVKNLALELVQQGFARVVEWSANMLEPSAKTALKTAELECKKNRTRIWVNFVPPPSNSTALRDDAFSGHVVEVVSGDCLIIADDSVPVDANSLGVERRVNLSSIRAKKMGNPKRNEKPEPYAREAKEFLRQRLVGQQVKVTMEYSRKMPALEDGGADGRVMNFGTVMLLHPGKLSESGDSAPGAAANGGGSQGPLNIAELIVGRGFAEVVRHRDFEERSAHYEALQAAQQRAVKGKRNIYSNKEPPVNNVNDLSLQGSTAKARNFLPFLQRAKRIPAIVDYVLSGHRFKLLVPRDSCAIAFALSGVRCPGRGEPYSENAIAFMRRKLMQHDVDIEVETVDRTGTFIGSLWVNRHNAGVLLLEAGLAKLHPSFAAERTAEGPLLVAAERKAKAARVGVWKDYVEGEENKEAEAAAGPAGALGGAKWGAGAQGKQEVMQVQVTEVLGGGRFYIVEAVSGNLQRMEEALKALNLSETKAPAPGSFVPKKFDTVLCQFSADKSWARAMVVSAPADPTPQKNSEYTVFYIDYGNQEVVPFSSLRPTEAAGGTLPVIPVRGDCAGLAQLCQLAHVKVPQLEDDFGVEAAQKLQELTVGKSLLLRLEQRDSSGGKAKGQGTGTCWMVTLVEGSSSLSVNAAMLQEGFARLEKRTARELSRNSSLATAFESLKEHQEVARKRRLNMWEYGDVESDEEDDRTPRGRF